MPAKEPWIVPLFGTRGIERLDENLGALPVERTGDAFDAIDGLSSSFHVVGARYRDDIKKRSDL
jgi:aryl-alcohol dehydrogenase-like predicted oxidoreductase